MSYQLNFAQRHHFRTTDIGITIPVTLKRNELIALCQAKVDTGCDYCIFQQEIATQLDIDVMDGEPIKLATLAGTVAAYAHTIELETLGVSFESTVLFSAAPRLPRNILGRIGWLNNLHLALTMNDEMIYLNPAYREEIL